MSNIATKKPTRIHIFGASGSGTTALGVELSKRLEIDVFDMDDYYWHNTDPPFQVTRSKQERFPLLLSDLKGLASFIISGHYAREYQPLDSQLTLAIFLYVPAKIRQERIRVRELKEYGSRILEGGDMYKAHKDFVNWAGHYDTNDLIGRKLKVHKERIELLKCPVLKIQGNLTMDQIIELIFIQLHI